MAPTTRSDFGRILPDFCAVEDEGTVLPAQGEKNDNVTG